LPLEREWVSIDDPDNDHLRYTFDVTFLMSNWRCIYGQGCPGISKSSPDPAIGCCVHGAYLNEDDDPEELERITREELDPTTMFQWDEAMDNGILELDEEGESLTRQVDGGCIFVNPTGFAAGSGCALHHLALRRGEHLMTHKPTVCWQVPLHRTISEEVANDGAPMEVHTIAAFERGTWGEGGADFDWWCTDTEPAYSAQQRLYRSMEMEIRTMVGDAIYEELASYLDGRARQRSSFVPLPLVSGRN
jgi:hypothetical protein